MQPDFSLAYTYDGSLEGLLSSIFLAYERKEQPADIVASDQFCQRLGQHVVEVPTNAKHALRVSQGIIKRCGQQAFEAVKGVSLSDDPAKGAACLLFVRYAMQRGPQALHDVTHASVQEFARLNRAVYNERHRWMQFMRFSQVEGGVYVARCNPNASVVPLLMDWFSQRFNTQPFIIYDEVHGLAGVSFEGQWNLVKTDSFDMPPATEADAQYQQAWKTFYDTVAVEARYNPELRRQFMPRRFWKNIVEVKDGAPAPVRLGSKEKDGLAGAAPTSAGFLHTGGMRKADPGALSS